MNIYDARKILNDIDRKLVLLKSERRKSKRDEIIDSMLNGLYSDVAQLDKFIKEVRKQ